jgi:hypothetical protein
MRYAVIARHRGEFEVRPKCRVLKASRSGCYASRRRPSRWHALIGDTVMAQGHVIHQECEEACRERGNHTHLRWSLRERSVGPPR